MSGPPEEIIAAIQQAQNILLVTHINPDGDALGSQLGLGLALEAMGKKVWCYGQDKLSYIYHFLPGREKLVDTLPPATAIDCGIALDCGDLLRLGKAGKEMLAIRPFIVIDHHSGHKDFGDLSWIDSQRAATGEMIFDLLTALNAKIPYEAAFALYTAIVADTGSFKYSSTTVDTFRIATELVRLGVQPAMVATHLYNNFSVNRLHLLRKVLDTLELYAADRISIIVATEEMFLQTGTTQTDTENFINYPRSLEPVKVAVFIRESKDQMISVSLRSKGAHCDVAQVADMFGGGGHRNAAGFKASGTTIAEVRQQLLDALTPLMGLC